MIQKDGSVIGYPAISPIVKTFDISIMAIDVFTFQRNAQ